MKRSREVCKSENLEHYELALQALDSAIRAGVLPALVKARQTDKQPPEGSEFPARRRRRPKRVKGVRGMVWSCEFVDAQIEVLDRLIEETGSSGYSELISVAVEADLLPDEE